MMGFGATAGVARFYNLSYPLSCLAGLAAGISVGAGMFYMLEFFAKQQANSLIDTQSLVGNFGTVAVGIDGNQPGEVAVSFAGRYATYVARSQGWAKNRQGQPGDGGGSGGQRPDRGTSLKTSAHLHGRALCQRALASHRCWSPAW